MKWSTLILLLLVASQWQAWGQTAPDTWWVQFTDKANTPYTIDQPSAYLSARSIERRQTQGILVDDLDLPVDPAYIATVLGIGDIQLMNRSRWFNAITIRTTDPGLLDAIEALPFVQNVRSVRRLVGDRPHSDKFGEQFTGVPRGGGDEDYGASFLQISMMNGHLLHELQAKGEGMLIGVLDSGFEGTDSLLAFSELRDRGGIVLTADMVSHDGDVYQDHWHGRSVLSCMAARLPGQLVGTAPNADYALVRTEDVGSEYIVEEDNWISGAELLDSLGCDILNTSLGYTVFDDSLQNHTYADLDGETTRISIAGGIASRKGMIPVTSAGNSGENDWYYISAPADAIDILAVGAVGEDAQPAPFSSHGPSADGRVKPDVSAMGWGTIGLGVDGVEVVPINGTSFASPLVAGLVACLWQLHPERTAQDIMSAVRSSASHFDDPTPQLGHGIPNFMLAHDILSLTSGITERTDTDMHLFPMPFTDRLTLMLPASFGDPVDITIFDPLGRSTLSLPGSLVPAEGVVIEGAQLAGLNSGIHVVHVRLHDRVLVRTVVKVP